MSITAEQANEMKDELAVLCCRIEEGIIIEANHLEDPDIFPDLVNSGLLTITRDCLKIGEVIGAKMNKTVDSLTPITPDIVDGVIKFQEDSEKEIDMENEKAILKINKSAGETISIEDLENPMHFDKLSDSLLVDLNDQVLIRKDVLGKRLNQNVPALNPITEDLLEGYKKIPADTGPQGSLNSGVLRIRIDEGKGIDIEVPIGVSGGHIKKTGPLQVDNQPLVVEKEKERVVRRLKRNHFQIDEVQFSDETRIEGKTLYIREDVCKDAIEIQNLVVDMKLEIITPDKYDQYSNTIMDVQPIATKEEGEVGEGITRVIDGVVVLVTGTDEKGVQIGEFGSSEGRLERNIMWGRPGSPDRGEIFIKTDVTVKEGTGMERPGPMAAHKATDMVIQEIREALKNADEGLIVDVEEFVQKRRPGKKKVLIIKEIMGQGAMHDNYLLPEEPVGTLGAKANVDLGNVPVVVSPLQVLDGCIHALTCIGPASKETSRHYWREPLILEAMEDEEIDLAGVVFVGSPQINSEKYYVSKLLGMTVESMDLDGAVVTTEGFGNNHIDFASHIEQVGKRGINVVGVTYAAVQGQLVVGNEYMDAMIDLNKSRQGIENEILENNCLTHEDAIRTLYMLKAKMGGEKIIGPERSWKPEVKTNNIALIEKTTGNKIEIAPNETSLKMNKKRMEIYEKDEVEE